ncbi:nitronate monooxygenase [Pseudarthrobacter sp. AL07]|uniref:NAD(P)H-dependent flavin oxidoreductase n=1 Tax=unclassified Pseudarthrobacter TaxID=2647000 RepID=UPI00249AE643|nr:MULTISPECIES: nitronate monooxygenase [unclassified Pseudarthrobacter]MDI3194207.1 nitronate monooxygenase [Pseudarthrobacter sp. AL20]MDI3208273.1 nitronate monooxygenase [Pseudarthrobacter sp. AL07]
MTPEHRTSARTNRITDLFGTDVPVVLGPFGGVSSVELTAAVSDGGGLGSYGLYGYGADAIRNTVAELRKATAKPFALNLWIPPGDETTVLPQAAFDRYLETLKPYFDELALPLPHMPDRFLPDYEEQVEATLAAGPAVVSFVFGVPAPELIEAAHRSGIVVVGTATTVAEAVALEAGGVDAVVASGMESGGHRVSFLKPAEESLIGTFALVPQVADAVRIPVIAAGGIADRRGYAAAMALGADAVQVGSAFLATRESAAVPAYRAVLHSPAARQTVLTSTLSGRLARGIPNRIIAELSEANVAKAGLSEAGIPERRIAPFPAQNWLTGRFRPEAAAQGNTDLMSLWAGQSAALIRHDSAADVLAELLAGTEIL